MGDLQTGQISTTYRATAVPRRARNPGEGWHGGGECRRGEAASRTRTRRRLDASPLRDRRDVRTLRGAAHCERAGCARLDLPGLCLVFRSAFLASVPVVDSAA